MNFTNTVGPIDKFTEEYMKPHTTNLRINHTISEEELRKLVSKYPNVTNIKILGKNITDEIIRIIAESYENLERIYLGKSVEITNQAIIALSENCKKLTHIDINSCKEITDRGLRALSENCKKLRQKS